MSRKKSFELFIELAKPYANDAMIADFLVEIAPIGEVYANLGTSLTLDDIRKIKAAIELVRASIVS